MMSATIRVLYVDDEPDLLEIGKLYLEDFGDFSITTVQSAPEALRLLEKEMFDAIISDYQMPGMDGIQFLVEVRSRFGEIPFILFTGRGREEIVIQAINSGVDFYLQKGGDSKAQFAELSHKVKQAASRKRAEDLLQKSEEKYRNLIEHADEAIVVAQDGMLRLANKRAIVLIGYPEQKILSMAFTEVIHPDDRAMVAERYQKRLKGEEPPSRYAFRISPKDGSVRWVEISAVVIDWDGHPATLNFLTDITERRRAEEALQLSDTQLRGILESTADGILAVDSNGKIVHVNRRFAEIWRVPPPLMELGNDRVLLDFVIDQLKDPDAFLLKVQSLYGSDAVDKDTLVFKDGRVTERYSSPIIMDGACIGRVWSFSDITERKRAEEALQFTRHSIDSVTEAMATIAKDGHFVDVNNSFCRKSGYSKGELLSMTVQDIDPDYSAENWSIFWNKLKQSGSLIITTTHHTKDGRTYPVESSLTYFESDGNEYHCGFARDITERKQAEEALHESEQRYRTLFETMTQGVVYHDREGRNIDANPAATKILGLSLDQMKGRSSVDPEWMPVHDDGSVFPWETHPLMIALKTGKEVRDVIMGLRNPEKEERIWISINAMPQFRPGEETPYQVYAIFEDITGTRGPAGETGKPGRRGRERD